MPMQSKTVLEEHGLPQDALCVRVSEVNAYITCPRMYYFAYVENLVPKVESPKLVFGRGIHEAIAVYYTTGSPQKAVDAYRDWLSERQNELKAYGSAAYGLLKEAEEIGEPLLRAYIAYAEKHDDFIPVGIEQRFAVPMWYMTDSGEPVQLEFEGRPVYHVGTFDGVVRNKYGKLWLMEHKTASVQPSFKVLKVDLQIGFYTLAARQLYGEDVCGVIYNVLRKAHPKRAKSPVIHRELLSRTDYEITQTVNIYGRMVLRMLSDRIYDPTPGHHCSWKCAYWQLCLSLFDGTPLEHIINDLYERKREVVESEDEG